MPDVQGGLLLRIARRRLDRKVAEALSLGAITQAEADAITAQSVAAIDWAIVLELILMLIELIQEWFNNR